MGCSKKGDPSPASNLTAGHGSWTYGGKTYTLTTTSWVNFTLVALADKPSSSGLEAAFSSASPATGDYSIPSSGSTLAANQVMISVVDSNLPAITYTSIDGGTVSVSRSGSSTTVTVTNLKLKGFTAKLALDSIYVTGTITKQ